MRHISIAVHELAPKRWEAYRTGIYKGPALSWVAKKPKKALKGLIKIMEEEGLFGPE